MRQKKLKQVNKEMLVLNGVLLSLKDYQFKDKDYHLEIGSGKGLFITNLALDNPMIEFIAIEVNMDVLYRIVQKKNTLGLTNLTIVLGEAKTLLEELKENTISKIYLNFSDPWPKNKHHKRRLTYFPFLKHYKRVLNKTGIIQFRTDHYDFFIDSINYLKSRFEELSINFDLKESKYMTEYEIKKRSLGPIYEWSGISNAK